MYGSAAEFDELILDNFTAKCQIGASLSSQEKTQMRNSRGLRIQECYHRQRRRSHLEVSISCTYAGFLLILAFFKFKY
jgi:hypothetical protein